MLTLGMAHQLHESHVACRYTFGCVGCCACLEAVDNNYKANQWFMYQREPCAFQGCLMDSNPFTVIPASLQSCIHVYHPAACGALLGLPPLPPLPPVECL